MFKHFKTEDLGQATLLKSSAIRSMKQSIIEMYPSMEPYIDDVLPKKDGIQEVKGKERLVFIVLNNEPLFFRQRDGPYFPTVRLLHKYPIMMTKVQVDAGGIKFILKGADVMCPGLTSAGGILPDLPAGCPVAIFAQGKETPMAVGVLKMSADEIRSVNKGAGVETLHHMGDELWTTNAFA